MRIASVTKPITAAAIKCLVRSNKLSLDTKAFEYLGLKAPAPQVVDERIFDITIGQLLTHKGGWDREKSFDPMFRTAQIQASLGLSRPVNPGDIIEYMLTQPLQFKPGERFAYSNFGYCVLGRVLEKATHKTFFEALQELIFVPLQIEDIRLAHSQSSAREAREVSYPIPDNMFSIEVMDAHGGLVASAPALCRFLDSYWINGEPRVAGQQAEWTFFGSLPGTTSLARQRRDGLNIVVLLNGRRGGQFNKDNELLLKMVEEAVGAVTKTRP
jgi:CubicO group peptidase (beta-lactamase class C family)